jgi:hypothetical protein
LLFVHLPKGYAAGGGGYEYVLLIGVACLTIAIRGGGPYSVDRAIGKELLARRSSESSSVAIDPFRPFGLFDCCRAKRPLKAVPPGGLACFNRRRGVA